MGNHCIIEPDATLTFAKKKLQGKEASSILGQKTTLLSQMQLLQYSIVTQEMSPDFELDEGKDE